MIPKAAVEAAEIVLIAHRRRDISSCQCGWAKLGRSHPLHQAQLALQAAAPHMQPINEGTSMTEHEELLNVLLAADDAHKAEGAMWPELATAILAAGYRKATK